MDAVLTMLRVVVSLAAVLGVIWYLHRRVSRRQLRTKKKSNPVTVVGKQGIAAKASVVVVDVDGRRLVLGVTEHSVNVLHSTEALSTELLSTESLSLADTSFAAVLAEADADAGVRAGADAHTYATQDAVTTDAAESYAPHPSTSPVAGSILSGSTWKLALTTVRNGLK